MPGPPPDTAESPEPLWHAVVGETEPWRRGRLFLILLGLLTACFQFFLLGLCVLLGDIERLLILAIFVLIFWLQYYFIWIGVHWVRWLSGAWNALHGFAYAIWGWRDHQTIELLSGIYLLGTGAYLGLAPSIYFFAKRQRAKVRWSESVLVGIVFLLLLASFGSGVGALVAYRDNLQRDAHHFADDAFRSIFSEHDTYFMLDHASKHLMQIGGGRAGLTHFLQGATIRAGDVKEIEPSVGSARFWFLFPRSLGAIGEMTAEGEGRQGRIRMNLTIGKAGSDWEIVDVHWRYVNGPARRPRS